MHILPSQTTMCHLLFALLFLRPSENDIHIHIQFDVAFKNGNQKLEQILPVVRSYGNACINTRYFRTVFDIDSILSLHVIVLQAHAPLTIRSVHHMIHNARRM